MDQQKKDPLETLSDAERVLISIGGKQGLKDNGRDVRLRGLRDPIQEELQEAYAVLWSLARDRDYYVVTTTADGTIYGTDFDSGRVVALYGNIYWRQCSRTCIKDIREEDEVPGDIYPHCRASLTDDTVETRTYIEENYLSRQEVREKQQTGALNRRLAILELGEGLKTPTVIW